MSANPIDDVETLRLMLNRAEDESFKHRNRVLEIDRENERLEHAVGEANRRMAAAESAAAAMRAESAAAAMRAELAEARAIIADCWAALRSRYDPCEFELLSGAAGNGQGILDESKREEATPLNTPLEQCRNTVREFREAMDTESAEFNRGWNGACDEILTSFETIKEGPDEKDREIADLRSGLRDVESALADMTALHDDARAIADAEDYVSDDAQEVARLRTELGRAEDDFRNLASSALVMRKEIDQAHIEIAALRGGRGTERERFRRETAARMMAVYASDMALNDETAAAWAVGSADALTSRVFDSGHEAAPAKATGAGEPAE